MEMKMQAQYDGWDAQMASAAADLKAYAHNLARFGGEGCCLAIERAWSLEGLPPEIVSDVLSRVAGGSSFDAAFDAATSPQTVPEEAVEDEMILCLPWPSLRSILTEAADALSAPSYDGSKSLGERLYELMGATFGIMTPWRNVQADMQATYHQAAVKFAAQLSDREEVEGLRAMLHRLRVSASLLQQNAEGCAVNHHGEDFGLFGMPGWLVDTAKDIEAARALLQQPEER